MADLPQTITVSIDAQDLVPGQQWTTKRREVTEQGALGVANNTGLLGVALNGMTAVRLWLHEDRSGYAVLDVLDAQSNERLARVEVELQGLVPPRMGSKGRRRG